MSKGTLGTPSTRNAVSDGIEVRKNGLRPQRILLAEDSAVYRQLIGEYRSVSKTEVRAQVIECSFAVGPEIR
jgi:hypothetical protein